MSELTLQASRRIDSRRVAVALACIWAFFAVAGLAFELGLHGWAIVPFDLADSDLDHHLGLAASFTALLLLIAGALAFGLAEVDRSRRHLTWRLAGVALVLFGLDELLGLHSWLDGRGLSWTFTYLPLLALGGAALYRAIGVLRSQRTVQALFAAAVGGWIVAGVLDDPDVASSSAAAQIIGMGSAALLVVCLVERLQYLARQYYPLEEGDTRLSFDQILAEAVERVKLGPIAIGLLLATALFALEAVLLQTHDFSGHRVPVLGLDGEQTIFATFQGALIAAAGSLALIAGFLGATPARLRRWWVLLGGALLILAFEEVTALPDRFESATDLESQLILIPVAVVGAVAWWKVLRATAPDRRVLGLLIAGTLLLIGSQATDLLAADHARWTIVPEKIAEALGSICLLVAFARWLRGLLPTELMLPMPIATLGRPATIEPPPATPRRVRAPTG